VRRTSQSRHRRLIKIAALLMVVACLSPALACTEPAGPVSGGTLYLSASAPTSLDPARCADAVTSAYVVELFSGLVTLDADLEVTADIAESWELDEGGTVYTFHLRDNVVFHDGRRVGAADFKYSMERAADPDTGSPVAEAYLGDIAGFRQRLLGAADEVAGVRVVDDRTLEITIDAPKACFLAKLTHPSAFVVDQRHRPLQAQGVAGRGAHSAAAER
jgi:oligopeptide transport system substrate-binding protein